MNGTRSSTTGTVDPSTPADTCAPMLVDRIEAGRLLGVSAGTIDNLKNRGELPSLKVLGRRLYHRVDLERFIEARKVVAK